MTLVAARIIASWERARDRGSLLPHIRQHHECPLIILHSLVGSSDNWHALGKRLGRQMRVFALDFRNHGWSPHTDEFNYAVMRDGVREFIEQV